MTNRRSFCCKKIRSVLTSLMEWSIREIGPGSDRRLRFLSLESLEAGRQPWLLDGNSSNNSGVEVKECFVIVLCEGRRSLTQPLELPLGLMGLGGSSMRRIMSGVNFRFVRPSLSTEAPTSTGTTIIGWPVIKAIKRLSQDFVWFSAGWMERPAAFFASRTCWNFLAKKYLELRSVEWNDEVEESLTDLRMKTITQEIRTL